MQAIQNPQATTKPYKTMKLTMPWNDAFSMTRSVVGGESDAPSRAEVAFNYVTPTDECLGDVKLIVICDRPTFSKRDKIQQMATHKLPEADPATQNYLALEENFVPQVEITISGMSSYTDA